MIDRQHSQQFLKPQPVNSHGQSIRRQLLTYLFVSIFVLLLVFSIGVIWLTQKGASELIVSNAQETTRVLAQQSTLALLTESVENAESALQQVRSFPDVVGAGLVTGQGEILDWKGDEQGRQYFSQVDWSKVSEEMLTSESEDFWHIASQVVLTGNADDEGELDLYEATEQYLGFAIISFSKQSLNDINQDLFITISIAGLVAIFGLPLIVSIVLRRLLTPLQSLSEVMYHNHRTGEHKVADVQGSTEVNMMAESFNSMMKTLDDQDEKLRSHRDQLEAEVNIRTQELVVARDAALTSNRYKSEFLANVTHELRSPIQSIIGYVELVKEEAENEGLYDILADLERVTRNAERLFNLINSILDLSKIEAGRMDVKLKTFHLQEVLTELEEVTAPLAPQNNNSFSLQVLCGNPELHLDPQKVLQILINLVSNACKFTQDGEIVVRVFVENNDIYFEVRDNGIGIPERQLERIFQKFQQVDGSDTRKFGGTGLGLAISQQFCELMKGHLQVTSSEGIGSCFTLKLPMK